MTAALASLDGLDDGTDIAVVVSNQVQRWQVLDGGLVRIGDSKRVDPWFFTGYLNEGAVMLGDFSPPQVGEWWAAGGSTYGFLVIATEIPLSTVAMFRRGSFYEWREQRNLLDEGYVRAEPPAWLTPEYLAMATLAYHNQAKYLDAHRKARAARDTQYNLTYARDYLNRAIEQIERTA